MGVFSGPRRPGTALAARQDGVTPSGLWGLGSPFELIPPRIAAGGPQLPVISPDTALRNSAVWACLRLRANLLSTLPVDVFRKVDGLPVAAAKPMVLEYPGGPRVRFMEWAYSGQFDKDRSGNTIGIISARDGLNNPARIDLQPIDNCSILTHGPDVAAYRIGGKLYDPGDIWHEKQFTVSGLPVGLSPVAYAAYTLGRWQSITDFAQSWFGGRGIPAARLRNTQKTLNTREAYTVKESWRAAVAANEPFVHGVDWEYDLMQAQTSGMEWLEAEKASVVDVARFFDCPADLIDAIVTTGRSITYANVTQRHLQFLILHLAPSIIRFEDALTQITPRPRYVKLNSDALLRMDAASRAAMYKTLIDARVKTPDECRALEEAPPLTQAQIGQFLTFWPPKAGGGPSGAVAPSPEQPAIGAGG